MVCSLSANLLAISWFLMPSATRWTTSRYREVKRAIPRHGNLLSLGGKGSITPLAIYRKLVVRLEEIRSNAARGL